jgi:hypothetical protein
MAVHQCRETIGLAIQGQPNQIVVTKKCERSCICCEGDHIERKKPVDRFLLAETTRYRKWRVTELAAPLKDHS